MQNQQRKKEQKEGTRKRTLKGINLVAPGPLASFSSKIIG